MKSEDLRQDWIKTDYRNVVEVISGKSQKEVESPNGLYPIYGSGGPIGLAKEYRCEPGTTIIGRKGTINSPIYVTERFWNIDTAFGLYPSTAVLQKFNYFFCEHFNFKKLDKSTAVPSLAKRDIQAINFLIPPLPEQRAIVAKIEELFSSLDNGIANLEKAQEQLKVYRQAVLKKAFEGELTKEWREKQTDLPSAEELLEQIKVERENYYEQQLADWKVKVADWEENGKEGKKPGKPRQRKIIENLRPKGLIDLAKLSLGWKWVHLGQVFDVFVGSTPSRKILSYWDSGDIHWVSSGEVAFKNIRTTKEKITQAGLNNSSTDVHPIGTVMLAMIGEGKTRGQAAILDIEACHNQNTAALRVPKCMSNKYLFYYLVKTYEENRRVGSGNNQKALNQTRINNFKFSICSFEEQSQIVQEIESRLSVCDKVEESIREGLQKAKALKQSILKKAFDGALLSEDELEACKKEADWKPAEVLLELIKGEKKKN